VRLGQQLVGALDVDAEVRQVAVVDPEHVGLELERALELALELLAPGGNFVGKLFQGPDFKKLTEAVRARFEIAKTAKPESSRQISIEQYVIGKGFKR
jgi:23S rRNA U2552 (ribose-2'-O)-methylase RlmE/FtsJ